MDLIKAEINNIQLYSQMKIFSLLLLQDSTMADLNLCLSTMQK